MVSPVPRHLRSQAEQDTIPEKFRSHKVDLAVAPACGVTIPGGGAHRAKYAPGLATVLFRLAGSQSVGDPMAGTGMLARETGFPLALNDIDRGMSKFLEPLTADYCEVSYEPADKITWTREVCVFSPPYYPRTDRRKPSAHNDAKRGPVVGFRDAYTGDHPDFVGNPGGVDAIKHYREQMTRIYTHMGAVCGRMIVVTKNWTRLGVELRLDLDTILMAQEAGWRCVARHGWTPPPSLWARFNSGRGGGVLVEDIIIFEK